jgi:hypothetical protein
MLKSEIVSYINKYHLGKLIESAIWTVEDSRVKIKFISQVNSTAGTIEFPFIDMGEKQEFGIFSTSNLLKFLSAMQEDISVTFEKDRGMLLKLNISDKVYSGSFSLARLESIYRGPKVNEPKVYDISFKLDKEFGSQFHRAYKALDYVKRFTIEAGKEIKITIGGKESYATKLSFSRSSDDFLPMTAKSFSAESLEEIIKNNAEEGTMEVSSEGIMKISFNSANHSVNYYLVELEEI